MNTQRSSGEPGSPTAGADASGVFFGSNTTLSVMSAPSPRNTYWRSVGSMMPRYSRPSDLVAADHRQHAVFELLQHVGLAVGLVDFRHQRLLVDAGVVVVDVEQLPREREAVDGVGLRFHAHVPVAGVVPAAAIQVRHRLAGLVVSQRRRRPAGSRRSGCD